jgi:hypothetical protein
MNDTNFEDILNTPFDEIERPKPLPPGTYLVTVTSFRRDVSSKAQTPFIEYTLQPNQAGEDVDEAELEAMGGIGTRTFRYTCYLTEGALWRLKDFLIACGLVLKGKNPNNTMEEAVGCQLTVHVKHTPNRQGTGVFAEVDAVAPVED